MEVSRYLEGERPHHMDAEAYFNRIYGETYPEILKFVIIKTSHADQVDDILQNTYHNFYTRILKKGFDDIQSPKAFIIRLAERELSRHYRRKALGLEKETDLDAYNEKIEPDGIPFTEMVENKDALDIVHDIVGQMPLLSYKSFILFYYYDMTIADIAEQLDISAQNVKVRLWRARNAVRKVIKDGGYNE